MELTAKAIELLKKGGIIAYSTDTIPGLGCDATNCEAVNKIFEIKQRPENKSMILLVSSDAMLQKYVTEVPEIAWDLIDLSDKPTTLIYPQGKNLPSCVLAQDGSIAIRMVRNGKLQGLIHRFGKPIISTSANLSGQPNPQRMSEIRPEILSKVDLVVDLPSNTTNKASSIIKIQLNGEFEIIRK